MTRRLFAALALAAFAVLALPAAARADGPAIGVTLGGGTGVVAPAQHLRFVPVPVGSRTLVEAISTDDGTVRGAVPIDGGAWGTWLLTLYGAVGGLSPDGALLVLGRQETRLPIRTTHILVIPTNDIARATLAHARRIDLRGDFSFDAVSADDDTLFLIQHLASGNGNRYQVRAYDLFRHRLLPQVVADRSGWEKVMAGWPIARVTPPGGAWDYTLYESADGSSGFVHALDTLHRRAVCIDLPKGITPDLTQLGMTLDLGRDRLDLNAHGAIVATIDTVSLRLHLGAPRPERRPAAAVADPGGGSLPWARIGLAALLLAAAAAASLALVPARRRRLRQ